MSENNRASKIKAIKEKDTARTICICIAIIPFALLILAVALPSMYKKYNEQAEKETLLRLEYLNNNVDEEIATALSANKSTEKVEEPEAVSDDIRSKESHDSAESKVIPRKDGTVSLVYTLQAGSFDGLQSAIKLYDSIINDLTTEDLAYLRIEKVGQYYAVRLGKFGERSNAEILHEKIRSHLSTAIIMQAYIKEERIKKLHSTKLGLVIPLSEQIRLVYHRFLQLAHCSV